MMELCAPVRLHSSARMLAALIGVISVNCAHAGDDSRCDTAVLTLLEAAALLQVDTEELQQLAERAEIPSRRVGTHWRFNCESLLMWLNGDWTEIQAFGSTVPTAAGLPVSPDELARVIAAGPAGTEATPIGEAPQERTAEDILLRDQRVLLDGGQVVLDFGQFYTERNGLSLASVDASAVLASVEQETFLSLLQARFGLNRDSELFVGTTYFRQDTGAFFDNEKIASSRTSDFGSVNLGWRRTLKREGPGRPGIIGTLSASIPTGDTSSAISGSLAFVKSIDPAVLFASVNYTHTFSQDFANIALLEPEDRVDVGIGYALALNDTLAISLSLSGNFTAATQFANSSLRQQDSYGLRFGLTSWLASGVYIEPSVTFNIGGPYDGLIFGLTVPYTLGRRSAAGD